MSYTPTTARNNLRDTLLGISMQLSGNAERALRNAIRNAIEEYKHEAGAVAAQKERRRLEPLLQEARKDQDKLKEELRVAKSWAEGMAEKADELKEERNQWRASSERIESEYARLQSRAAKLEAALTIAAHQLESADDIAKAIDRDVRAGHLDSRSAISDARLTYGQPGEYVSAARARAAIEGDGGVETWWRCTAEGRESVWAREINAEWRREKGWTCRRFYVIPERSKEGGDAAD